MFIYAQLNSDGVVEGVSRLSGEVNVVDMIRLREYNTTFLGKKYNYTNKTFEDVAGEEAEIESEAVTNQKLQRQTLLILDALADLLAEYPLPEGRKAEIDIYAELIEAGRRELKDVPEPLKEAVGKKLPSGEKDKEIGEENGGLSGRG